MFKIPYLLKIWEDMLKIQYQFIESSCMLIDMNGSMLKISSFA